MSDDSREFRWFCPFCELDFGPDQVAARDHTCQGRAEFAVAIERSLPSTDLPDKD